MITKLYHGPESITATIEIMCDDLVFLSNENWFVPLRIGEHRYTLVASNIEFGKPGEKTTVKGPLAPIGVPLSEAIPKHGDKATVWFGKRSFFRRAEIWEEVKLLEVIITRPVIKVVDLFNPSGETAANKADASSEWDNYETPPDGLDPIED